MWDILSWRAKKRDLWCRCLKCATRYNTVPFSRMAEMATMSAIVACMPSMAAGTLGGRKGGIPHRNCGNVVFPVTLQLSPQDVRLASST